MNIQDPLDFEGEAHKWEKRYRDLDAYHQKSSRDYLTVAMVSVIVVGFIGIYGIISKNNLIKEYQAEIVALHDEVDRAYDKGYTTKEQELIKGLTHNGELLECLMKGKGQ